MRKYFLLVTLSFPLLVQAQFLTPHKYMTLTPTVLYVEGFGVGKTYSVNLETLFAQFEWFAMGSRFGIGYTPGQWSSLEENQLKVPVMLNTLFGNKDLLMELGGGVRVDADPFQLENGWELLPVGSIGIRMHPIKSGGLFWHVVYTPTFLKEGIQHGVGFAVGIGFEK